MVRHLSLLLVTLFALVGCSTGSSGDVSLAVAQIPLPAYMNTSNETYHETGAVPHPANAVDVFIVYAPESQQYMPRIIEAFNRASASGQNPVTGQPWGAGEKPIFVAGQEPTSGSSGSVAQGIVNSIIAPNNRNVYHPTIFQPSVSHWLALVNYNAGRDLFDLANIRPTALTPVVVGMWQSRVEAIQRKIGSDEIGWNDLIAVLESPNGWCDYGLPDCRRAVYYGHTDPNVSSTGLSTTIAEFYACARENQFTDRLLSLEAVRSDATQNCVRRIESLVRHYSGRTEDFLEYISRGPDYLDFLALEETDLICLNTGAQQGDQACNQPQEPLVAIYPKEGTFWDEHPFGIVNANWVTQEQKDAARIFTDYVLAEDSQQIIMSEGFRPANPNVKLAFPFVAENGVDPLQPKTILDVPPTAVIVEIQQSWRLVKKKADVALVIDTSGSMMDEDKIGQARAAAANFISEMDRDNRISLTTFSDTINPRIPLGNFEAVQNDVKTTIEGLRADGGTALYDALAQVINTMNEDQDTERIRAVVLLSDGQDTGSSAQLNDVLQAIEASRSDLNPVLVIPVAYGSGADVSTLNSIARASSTSVQSGDPQSILSVLQVISSYF